MPLARKILLAATGVLGAAALILGMTTVHKPAHIYDGMGAVHAYTNSNVVKAPQHIYDG